MPGINPGEYLLFGSYLNAPVLWRVIHSDPRSLMCFSEDILCLKPFDSKGFRKQERLDHRNFTREFMEEFQCSNSSRADHGSNYWGCSTLREWLNSDLRYPRYSHDEPAREKVGGNPYADEPGFLHSFTREERERIIPMQHKVLLNKLDRDVRDGGIEEHDSGHHVMDYALNYDRAYFAYFTDLVYLPCIRDIREYVRKREWQPMKKMTAGCLENALDKACAGLKEDRFWNYWLSTPARNHVECPSCLMGEIYVHSPDPSEQDGDTELINEARIGFDTAFSGYTGVAPIIHISAVVKPADGDGTAEHPWRPV